MEKSRPAQSHTDNDLNITDVTSIANKTHANQVVHVEDGEIDGMSSILQTSPHEPRPWSWATAHNEPEEATSSSDQSGDFIHGSTKIDSTGARPSRRAPGLANLNSGTGITDAHHIHQSVAHPAVSTNYSEALNPSSQRSELVGANRHYPRGDREDDHHTTSFTDQAARLSTTSTSTIDPVLTASPETERFQLYSQNGEPYEFEITSAELEALDYLMSDATNLDPFPSPTNQGRAPPWTSNDCHGLSPLDQIMAESPDAYASWYPNPAYRELHTVLHHHIVETAKTTAQTRQGTPDLPPHVVPTTNEAVRRSQYMGKVGLKSTDSMLSRLDGTKLTPRRQMELWQNYLTEVAEWLDMFDIERHFQLKIPMLAKAADHLHYSILALSARQMERKDPDKPYTESLALYQKAIELIVPELQSLDTAVIASCVLLCVLEMMSSSPKAWGRHLHGCAMLLQAAGINGVVGDVRQALFWCFARMDVWGGFLSDTLTKIPTSRWFIPSGSMSSAVGRFRTESGGIDSYANYGVFLCASVVNVISNRNATSDGKEGSVSDSRAVYSARWKALFDLLEDWYSQRPEEMRPLVSYPTSLDDHHHPFPIVLYGPSPAVNGNQLYHASALLMLQEKPKDLRLPKTHKSILWHARQICGIATSNFIHGPWINALQPLWIAGKVMSHPTEHKAILDILARIEKETGWATSWRAQDLKDYWGETEE
jgi:Fungal specific transcription factor domain